MPTSHLQTDLVRRGLARVPSATARSPHRRHFWRDALALHGSVTPYVLPRVLVAGLLALAICALAHALRTHLALDVTLDVAPHELAGAVLGVLLVIRTNAGYDRWWEARKL
jgi:putative membrane protein